LTELQFLVSNRDHGDIFNGSEPRDGETVELWRSEATGEAETGSTFGVVLDGEAELELPMSRHKLSAGCYFALAGRYRIEGGRGMLIHRPNHVPMTIVGGPVERVGRLKYIDGCTDSLLIPPSRLGEPCLNALYFPPNTQQTFHTHPSVRIGAVLWGQGYCDSEGECYPLRPGHAFYLPAHISHRFRTTDEEFAVVAYHPDSDFGPQDEDHPMVNRTMVGGVSAAVIDDIRTR
jgi:hypothetical protein